VNDSGRRNHARLTCWQFRAERAKDKARPAVPVVVFSAGPDSDEGLLPKMGAEGVIRKPATEGALLGAVGWHCLPKSA